MKVAIVGVGAQWHTMGAKLVKAGVDVIIVTGKGNSYLLKKDLSQLSINPEEVGHVDYLIPVSGLRPSCTKATDILTGPSTGIEKPVPALKALFQSFWYLFGNVSWPCLDVAFRLHTEVFRKTREVAAQKAHTEVFRKPMEAAAQTAVKQSQQQQWTQENCFAQQSSVVDSAVAFPQVSIPPGIFQREFHTHTYRTPPGFNIHSLTAMIGGIPYSRKRDEVLLAIDQAGYRGHYDFFYLVPDKDRQQNKGIAFINFVDPESRNRFAYDWNHIPYDMLGLKQKSKYKPSFVPALKLQGFEANCKYYSNPKNQLGGSEDSMPIVLEDGVYQPLQSRGSRGPRASAKSRAQQYWQGGSEPLTETVPFPDFNSHSFTYEPTASQNFSMSADAMPFVPVDAGVHYGSL